MPSLFGVTYTERKPSRRGSYSRDNVSLPREFDIDTTDFDTFLAGLLGGVTTVGGVTIQEAPHRYKPGSRYYARNVSTEGLGAPSVGAGNLITYPKTRVSVDYGPLTASNADEEGEPDEIWGDEELDSSVQMLQVPGYHLKFSDGKKLDQPTGIPVVFGTLVLRRYDVAVVKESFYKSRQGKINSSAFGDYAAGTLLFAGYTKQRTINIYSETPKYTVSLKFLVKPSGWNKVLRETLGGAVVYEKVFTAGGGTIFPEVSFNL